MAALALTACASTAAVPPAPPPAAAAPASAPPGPAQPADTDGDGIPDSIDECEGEPETPNGFDDEDGCPDVASSSPGRLVERIGFQHDSAEVKAASYPMLDAIAIVLKQQPHLFPLVALEGHAADNERSPMRLSLERASAVRVALLARGVDAGRLLARASGSTAPSCAHRNEVCWARERTVEFVTLAAAERAAAAATANSGEAPGATATESKPAGESAAATQVPLERIEFKKGSAVLAPAALAELDVLAGFMKANSAYLEIVGYADERENGAAALAEARAGSVKRYMIACGVAGAHLIVRAERTSRATCRSHSANCPARNGRAELQFIEPKAPPMPAETPAPAATPP